MLVRRMEAGVKCIGLARAICIRFIYGIIGRETTKETVKYG